MTDSASRGNQRSCDHPICNGLEFVDFRSDVDVVLDGWFTRAELEHIVTHLKPKAFRIPSLPTPESTQVTLHEGTAPRDKDR